jgi:cell division septum initiation protein DivIVA
MGPAGARARLHELRSQHQSLKALLLSLEEAIAHCAAHPSSEASAAALRRVTELEIQLPAHFAFEEAGGYLADALSAAPRLSRQASQLLGDHDHLRHQLAEFVARAQRAQPGGWSSLSHRMHELSDALRQHELEENRLLRDALLDDLGGG